MKIKFKGIDFEILLEEKETLICRQDESNFIKRQKNLITGARFKNLHMNAYQFLKFKNIIDGYIRNILGGVEDENFKIEKRGKTAILVVIFNKNSDFINKIDALNLLDLIRNSLKEFDLDLRKIQK